MHVLLLLPGVPRKKTRKRETAHAGSDEEDQGSASDQDSRQSEEREGIEEIEERGKPSAAHQQQPKPQPAFKGKAAQRDAPEEDRDVEMEAPAEPEEVSDGLDEHECGLANTLRSQAPATPKKAKTVSGSSPSKSCKEAEKGPTTRGRKASESTRAPAEATSKPSSSRKIVEVSIPTSPPSRRKDAAQSKTAMVSRMATASKMTAASKTDRPWYESSLSSDEEEESIDREANDSEKGDGGDDESDESGAEVIVKQGKGKASMSKKGKKKGKRVRAQASTLPDHITPAKNMGQAYLRLYIALDTTWTKYGAMSDNRLQDVMRKVVWQVKAHRDRDSHHPKELRAAFEAVKGEEGETVRKAMTDVVWTAASQMRNNLKKKAKLVAEEAYDLSNLSSKQKEVLVAWLTQSYKQPLRGGVLVIVPNFIFGNIKVVWTGAGKKAILDEKNCSVDLRKPFQHPAIWQLVHSYWFSGSGNSELKAPQERFSKVPNNLIALVCNALEAALRDVVHPDTQFSNKIYAPKYDDHMALLEEIEHTSPDAHAGIKKKIWDKVSAKLTAEQNTIGVDRLGLIEGAPQGIPFDNLVVVDDDDDDESDKEVDELEGSVPPQPTSVVANVQEQDAIAEDPATRSRRSTKGSESTTTGRPVAASSQVVPDEPRTGPSAVTSGGGTSDRDAAGAAAGMLNPADQADQAVGEAASVEEPSARGEKQSAGASESDGATAARTDSLRAPEAGVSKPAP
ncbi:hypothetical protein C8Q72DRAFT_891055 [Fomitopsis betulina]|nr:hypothetical protein C8Q72DRAFT_891055 [Fomitopsis betulina]